MFYFICASKLSLCIPYRQCELLVAKGELTQVWELLSELHKSPEMVGELRVRLLLMESCVAVAGGGNAVAIPLLVEALTTAHDHHLTYLAAITHLHTANVQVFYFNLLFI